jgi:hypothetical protein
MSIAPGVLWSSLYFIFRSDPQFDEIRDGILAARESVALLPSIRLAFPPGEFFDVTSTEFLHESVVDAVLRRFCPGGVK